MGPAPAAGGGGGGGRGGGVVLPPPVRGQPGVGQAPGACCRLHRNVCVQIMLQSPVDDIFREMGSVLSTTAVFTVLTATQVSKQELLLTMPEALRCAQHHVFIMSSSCNCVVVQVV
jgi:hypothetical protein